MKPRILFVANPILGWNTYSKRFISILETDEEIEAKTLWFRPARLASLITKRHNPNDRFQFFRHADLVALYRGQFGRKIRRAVQEFRPDAIHFSSHLPAGALAWEADAPPFTISLDCTRNSIETDFKADAWQENDLQREKQIFESAAHVFPMSNWAAKSIQDDYGIPTAKISLSPPSTDFARFRPKKPHDGQVNVIFVGNEFIRKGGDRMARWVNGPLSGKCHFHIISSDPEAADFSGPNITFHGSVSQDLLFQELLPEMDIFCLPTLLDMSPHVLVEAGAAGLPSVASDLGGIPDLVLHGETGFLAPPQDDDAFLSHLTRLIDNPELRFTMGSAAKDHIHASCDASRNLTRVLETAKSLAKQRQMQ